MGSLELILLPLTLPYSADETFGYEQVQKEKITWEVGKVYKWKTVGTYIAAVPFMWNVLTVWLSFICLSVVFLCSVYSFLQMEKCA